MKKASILLVLAFMIQVSWGQQELSLKMAIRKTIAQNPSIKIQSLQNELAANQVFKANAGLLPTVSAIGSASYLNSLADVRLRTFQPEPMPEFIDIQEAGVETANVNVGIQADYILYDRGQGNARLRLLEGLSDLEKAKQGVLINELVKTVSELYLEILKLQNQATFLRENIEISKIRIQKVEDRKLFGKANQLDILQLQNALNQDEAALEEVLLIQENLKQDLNFLMGESLNNTFDVNTVSITVALPASTEISNIIIENNPQLQLSRMGVKIADQELALQKLANKPVVASFGNIGYNFQSNDVQQLARIHTGGITLGINASYPIFDGGLRNKRVQNAEISRALANSEQNLLAEQLTNQAIKEQNSLTRLQSQLQREQRNLATFEATYEKVQELYLVGKANNLSLRDAELGRLNALLRIDQLQVDILKAQIRLNQLMGKVLD